jgi:hypothetical protein
MKRADLPSIATLLLSFVASEQPALAGDLTEELRAGRSRRWLWTQLIGAVLVVAWNKRRSQPVVVRLVTETPYDRPDRSIGQPRGRPARCQEDSLRRHGLLDPAMINLSGTNVRSVGGLGLLAMVVLTTVVMPQTWLLAATGLAGGIVVGIVLVRRRRDVGLSGPPGSGPLGLSGAARVDAATDARVAGPAIRVADIARE